MPLRRIAMVTPSLAPLVKKQFIFARRKIKLDYSKVGKFSAFINSIIG